MEAMKLDQPDGGRSYLEPKHTDTYPYIDSTKADMSGKTVLVTGASKGVGKAIALSYAKAGVSNIAILARTDLTLVVKEVEEAAKQVNRPQPKITTIKCDITSAEDCANAAKQVEQAFGGLDILINNAGYLETWKKIADSDPDDWWRSFEVNVKGVYLMCRAFLPLLLKRGDKTIITVSSGGAHVISPRASSYQTTKQVQLRFTDFLCAEYGSEGLLAYSIHPGGIKTDLGSGMPEDMHFLLKDEPGLPGDTVVWLTKEKRYWLADRYVSVQWDMEELESKRQDIEDRNLLRVRLRT